METITLHRITDIAEGDRVTPRRNIGYYGEQAVGLKDGEIYTVIGVHPIGRNGGSLSLEGIENPASLSKWVAGSFGFALFDKVKDPEVAEAEANVERAIQRADENYAKLLQANIERDAAQVEVATLRDENARLRLVADQHRAAIAYARDYFLTEDESAAVNGFMRGFDTGAAR